MYFTPLRYPGGKGKLAKYLKTLFEYNDLYDGHYVEVYAGGSAVALELLILEYASHIHINDIDNAIYSFWYSVLYETENLCRLINDTPVTMSNWYKQRDILKKQGDFSHLELGFATFFLNRTNRSGILKGGVIGGKDQSGYWKLDVRFNKPDLIARIEKIARLKNRITLYTKDASELLIELSPKLPKKSLIYLDPPYYVKGKGLYRNFYLHEDHVAIEKILRKMKKFFWLVSYDNVEQIKEIYSRYRQQEYSLSYTAQEKIKGSEVVIYSPTLQYPAEILPYYSKAAS